MAVMLYMLACPPPQLLVGPAAAASTCTGSNFGSPICLRKDAEIRIRYYSR